MVISQALRNSIVTVAGWALMTVAMAQTQTPNGPPPGEGGADRPHGPPPEAIAACQGKVSGAACTFTGRRGEQLTGTCFSPPPRMSGNAQGSASTPKAANSSPRPMACRPPRPDNGQ